jgi:pyruvate dehydrogenase E2 component (dihydrolipoamide acetyltransferase)
MAEVSGAGAAAAPTREPPRKAELATPAPIAPAQAPAPARAAAPAASPAARRRARELGLDLAAIAGSGPGGAVRLTDVERAARAPPGEAPAAAAAPRRFEPAGMRAAIAAAMARSKREIPHYYLSHEIDLQPATDWLAATNAARPPQRRLMMGVLLVRATALAARDARDMNGVWIDGAFARAERVHVGVAVALRGGGLVAPALHDADVLDLDELMAKMRELVTRARVGRLRSSEISDPTITVSSLGERGVDALQGVIFPPQVAIVGFGTPRLRPFVVGEGIAPRTVVEGSLAADHRVSDGRSGARFLADIASRLQTPEAL